MHYEFQDSDGNTWWNQYPKQVSRSRPDMYNDGDAIITRDIMYAIREDLYDPAKVLSKILVTERLDDIWIILSGSSLKDEDRQIIYQYYDQLITEAEKVSGKTVLLVPDADNVPGYCCHVLK